MNAEGLAAIMAGVLVMAAAFRALVRWSERRDWRRAHRDTVEAFRRDGRDLPPGT